MATTITAGSATKHPLSTSAANGAIEPARSAGYTAPLPWTQPRHSAGFAEFGAWTQLLPGAIREDLWQYRTEIAREPLLTAEQEVELARRIEIGLLAGRLLDDGAEPADAPLLERVRDEGTAAFARMVRANLRLVFNIAQRFGAAELSTLDRIQFGNLGLIHAVEKFDFTVGTKFSTYATHWIKQSIRRGTADEGRLIRLPVHVQEALARGTAPRGRRAEELPRAWCSIDDLAALEADGLPCRDGLVDTSLEHLFDTADARELICALLSVLSAKEQFVLRSRFGLEGPHEQGMTLDEIGRLLGVTRERVRQIQKKALDALTELVSGPPTEDGAPGAAEVTRAAGPRTRRRRGPADGKRAAGASSVSVAAPAGHAAVGRVAGGPGQATEFDGRPQGPVMASV